ncbi:hypothetical protein CHUAL_000775 [Chamberlinius hualienensis]
MNSISRRMFSWSLKSLRSSFHSTSIRLSDDTIGDHFYNSEHRALQKTVIEIIEKDINPHVNEWEKNGEFPAHEVYRKLGQAGLLGINKPKAYGGLGLGYIYNVAAVEALGTIKCRGIPMAIAVQTDMATPALAKFGSDELKKEFLVPSIAGDYVSAIGVSEPDAGSDVANIATNAVKQGGDYIINGSKIWVTNALHADWICILVNTSKGNAHQNKSLICVPMKAPGVHVDQKTDKMGTWSSDTAEMVYFKDVRVPQKNLIGEEGKGFLYQMLQFQEERIAGCVSPIQPLIRAIESTREYCRDRKIFGKPLLHNQYIHFRLAELATEVEAYRALVYQTAKLYGEGHDVSKWASMCKLKAGRLNREVFDTCLQFWGGKGYTTGAEINRGFRDGRLASIAGGSDEIMLIIISKYMNMVQSSEKKKAAV